MQDITYIIDSDISFLMHYGIEGMKWGIRRYQNFDGSYTLEGKKRYGLNKELKVSTIKGAKNLIYDTAKAKGVSKEKAKAMLVDDIKAKYYTTDEGKKDYRKIKKAREKLDNFKGVNFDVNEFLKSNSNKKISEYKKLEKEYAQTVNKALKKIDTYKNNYFTKETKNIFGEIKTTKKQDFIYNVKDKFKTNIAKNTINSAGSLATSALLTTLMATSGSLPIAIAAGAITATTTAIVNSIIDSSSYLR